MSLRGKAAIVGIKDRNFKRTFQVERPGRMLPLMARLSPLLRRLSKPRCAVRRLTPGHVGGAAAREGGRCGFCGLSYDSRSLRYRSAFRRPRKSSLTPILLLQ